MQSAIAQLIVVCKKRFFVTSAAPPQLLALTVDSNETERWQRHPWCSDEAARSGLGVAAPQTMQSAIAQLIVVCKNNAF
jgi:hypothetical protein